jgi:hypothetical protein
MGFVCGYAEAIFGWGFGDGTGFRRELSHQTSFGLGFVYNVGWHLSAQQCSLWVTSGRRFAVCGTGELGLWALAVEELARNNGE